MKSKEPWLSRVRRRLHRWLYRRIQPSLSNVMWLSSSCNVNIGPDGDSCAWTGWMVTIRPTNAMVEQGLSPRMYGPFKDPGNTVDLLDVCAAAYIAEFPQIGFPR